jgi:hypothetical protein
MRVGGDVEQHGTCVTDEPEGPVRNYESTDDAHCRVHECPAEPPRERQPDDGQHRCHGIGGDVDESGADVEVTTASTAPSVAMMILVLPSVLVFFVIVRTMIVMMSVVAAAEQPCAQKVYSKAEDGDADGFSERDVDRVNKALYRFIAD